MTATAAPARPVTPPNRPSVRMVVAAVAVAAAVTAVVVAGLALRDRIWMLEIDFKVYNVAGLAVLNGMSPYEAATIDGFLFIYPPFTALTFVPLGLMSVDVGFAVWTFITVLALEAAVWIAFGLVAVESPARRAKFVLLATVAALPTAPLVMHLSVGQINVLLMLLLLADLARRPGRFQGVAIGLAAGLKLLPLLFVAYFLITRRIRAAMVSLATFAATVVVGFLVMPGPSAAWWFDLMLDTGRMTPEGAAPFNQSMRGVLGQLPGLLHTTWFWLTLAIPVGVAGLVISAWASRRGMEAAGVFACAVTGLLVSPVSWPDHWVWAVPGLALWLWWARHRRSTANVWGVALVWLVLAACGTLIFLIVVNVPVLSAASTLVPGSLTTLVALSGMTLLIGLGYLGTLAAILWRKERQSPAASVPS
ncbi:glycosyltransferase 87 family protein [Amycolatopsis aidingensis]|uniref:glycosyltransferase 87 family protein n=1 Tax=Amycolatopsis aidingensis TaxID=2842453 RepID=UPI001C0E0908|nr:glycosyltransferase 87 family protein [Amycolatopsis aidingensis]